jgi:hypothetical protein
MAKKKTEDQPGTGYLVIQRFMDKGDSSIIYEVGDDVSHLEEDRLSELVSKGLIESGEEPAEDKE